MSIQSILAIIHPTLLALVTNLFFPIELVANEDTAKIEAFETKNLSIEPIGRLQIDHFPEDARFTSEDLKEYSLKVAHINEYARGKSKAVTPPYQVVMRWEGPIRYRFRGDSLTDQDVAAFIAYAKTLSAVTGASIEMSETDANLDILFIGPEVRVGVGSPLEAQIEDGQFEAFRAWFRTNEDPCRAYFQVNKDHVIVRGVISIRTDIRGPAREACIQEQLGPTLGP